MNTQNYKFKICKFFIRNKCRHGYKCSFEHLNLFEIETMVKKLRDTQSENDFLKKKINEMNTNRQYSNPKDRKEEKIANFSTNDVHVLS